MMVQNSRKSTIFAKLIFTSKMVESQIFPDKRIANSLIASIEI
jgi:hypothetical protein